MSAEEGVSTQAFAQVQGFLNGTFSCRLDARLACQSAEVRYAKLRRNKLLLASIPFRLGAFSSTGLVVSRAPSIKFKWTFLRDSIFLLNLTVKGPGALRH
jgi:hypothetical protein